MGLLWQLETVIKIALQVVAAILNRIEKKHLAKSSLLITTLTLLK